MYHLQVSFLACVEESCCTILQMCKGIKLFMNTQIWMTICIAVSTRSQSTYVCSHKLTHTNKTYGNLCTAHHSIRCWCLQATLATCSSPLCWDMEISNQQGPWKLYISPYKEDTNMALYLHLKQLIQLCHKPKIHEGEYVIIHTNNWDFMQVGPCVGVTILY